MTKHVLVDSDMSVYGICNQCERANPEGEPLPNVLHSLKLQTAGWITAAGGNPADFSTFQLYLSGPSGTNFRFEVDPEYKATRPATKPRYYKEAREYLVSHWGALVVTGEADDKLAAALYADYVKANDEAVFFGDDIQLCTKDVLVSGDKDLNITPGWHYNPIKKLTYWVSPFQGMQFFFKQMIMGDSVDNIKGVPFAGEGAANAALKGVTTDLGLYHAAVKMYATKKRKGEYTAQWTDVYKAADLLWMVRDCRRGSTMLMDMEPGHVTKARFDNYRAEAEKSTTKPKRRTKKDATDSSSVGQS